MANVCSICTHPDRKELDRLLVSRGASYRDIARRFGVSKSALARHRKEHLPALLAMAYEAEQVAHSNDLLAEANMLRTKTLELLERAEHEGDLKTALAGVRTALSSVELLAKMAVAVDERARREEEAERKSIEREQTEVEAGDLKLLQAILADADAMNALEKVFTDAFVTYPAASEMQA